MTNTHHIVYIGNFLGKLGYTPAPNELICYMLSEDFQVRKCSEKRSVILRFIHILVCTLGTGLSKRSILIIDVFSSKAFWFAWAANEIGKLLHVPRIIVLHGGDLPTRYKNTPFLSRRLLTGASKIISPSGYLKQVSEAIFSVDVQVIPNPIQTDLYHLKERSFERPKILWVRSFHHIYHPTMAIRVLAEVSSHYSEAKLCMVGPDKDGSLQQCKDLAVSLGLENRVAFTGLLSKKEWISLSEDYNIFINTTHFDNTPVSVIEALALGLPVVSTNVGGIPWLLQQGKTALLVDDGDEGQMGKAIHLLMKDVMLRQTLVQEGRKLAESMDFKQIGKQWRHLIRDVVP